MILLAAPFANAAVSGGYRYNTRLTAAAGIQYFEGNIEPAVRMATRTSAKQQPAKQQPVVILDSLYINTAFQATAAVLTDPAVSQQLKIVLLLHLPPGVHDRFTAQALPAVDREVSGLPLSGIIMPSQQDTPWAMKQFDCPIMVVEPGVDADVNHSRSVPAATATKVRDRRSWLTVANWCPRKGIDFLFDVFDQLWDSGYRSWTWTCLGDTRHDDEYGFRQQDRLQRAPWAACCHLAGSVAARHMNSYYARHGLLLQPSYYESYGMAVAEAVAAGLPVISAPTGCAVSLQPFGVRVCRLNNQAWFQTLTELVESENQYHDLVNDAGRAALPSWRNSARQLFRQLSANDIYTHIDGSSL